MKRYKYIYDQELTKKNIKKQTKVLSEVKLSFMKGKTLGDIDILTESGSTRRKVRRIIEKRVCQDFYKSSNGSQSNYCRYQEKRRVSNRMSSIFGQTDWPKSEYAA